MAPSLRSAAAAAFGIAAFTISGCGDSQSSTTPSPPSPSPTPPGPGPAPGPAKTTTKPATTTTTTAMPAETSIWAWRKDLDHGIETTYDLTGDQQHSIYGGCWARGDVDTVGIDEVEEGVKFVEMNGETGVTLFNKRKAGSSFPGCLMRKTRKQIDLSVIGRMELDISVTGQGTSAGVAPWYSVWLVPMNYSDPGAAAKAAEIDLLENYVQWAEEAREDCSGLFTNFAQCGIDSYTLPYCTRSDWYEQATDVNHHLTLKARQDPTDGRVLEVHRCRNTGSPMETCESQDNVATIRVEKQVDPAEIPNWFPIWNRDEVGDNYAKYWLAADMWYTSETDFTLSVDNVRFFHDDDTEWKMPLDYSDEADVFPPREAETQALETVV